MAIFLAPLVRWALALAGVAVIVTWFGAQQRQIGAADLAAKMERQDDAAAKKITAADAASRKPAGWVRKHVRDPNAVSE